MDKPTPIIRKAIMDYHSMVYFIEKKYGRKISIDSGIGIKPMSEHASKRLVRKAIEHAIDHDLQFDDTKFVGWKKLRLYENSELNAVAA